MSGPHEDVEKENERLRKEVRLLREEREVLKNRSGLRRLCCANWLKGGLPLSPDGLILRAQ